MSIYVHVRLSVCLSVCVLNLSLLLLPQASGCRTPNSSQAPPIPLIPPYPSLPIPYLTHFTMSRRTMRLSHFHVILSVNLVATNASRLLNKKPRPLPACLLFRTPGIQLPPPPSSFCCCSCLRCALMPVIRAMSPSNMSVMRAIFACHALHSRTPLPPPAAPALRKYQRLFAICQAATWGNFWSRGSCRVEAEQTGKRWEEQSGEGSEGRQRK